MGQPKLKTANLLQFKKLLQKWDETEPFGWEQLRQSYAAVYNVSLDIVWTRQALSRHASIAQQFAEARDRIQKKNTSTEERSTREIANWKDKCDELQKQIDALLLRNRELIFNTALLNGGKNLLNTPLPSNHRSQETYTARNSSRRNTPF